MSCSVIHCIMEKSGSGSAMKSNSLFSKNVLSLVLVIGCPPYVCFSNNILELPMTFFNYQIANFILHYRKLPQFKDYDNQLIDINNSLINDEDNFLRKDGIKSVDILKLFETDQKKDILNMYCIHVQ